MKGLTRHHMTYPLHKLPNVKNFSFQFKKMKGCTGSIVRRKIKGDKVYWHYAFVYGFDKDNRLLLIENNENGVECIHWEDFILDFMYWEFVHIEPTLDNFNDIMTRARERAKHDYHSSENNCEHFVNYSIYKKFESIQAYNTKLVANTLMLVWEARLVNSSYPSAPSFLNELNKLREFLYLERGSAELDKIVGNKIKSTTIPLKPGINLTRPKFTLVKAPLPKNDKK